MQAAIGKIQLKRMLDWHRIRLKNANKIWDAGGNAVCYEFQICQNI